MDGIPLLGLDGRTTVHRLADDVEDAPQNFPADRNGDGLAGVLGQGPPHEPFGGRHAHRADGVLPQMLGHFDNDLAAAVAVALTGPENLQGVSDCRKLARRKLHVHNGADDLCDFSLSHGIRLFFCCR